MILRRLAVPAVVMLGVVAGIFISGKQDDSANEHRVVATIFPVYDFASAIGGEKWSVELAVPLGADIHTFALTPRRMQEIRNCGLFLYCGRGIEPWAEKLAREKDRKFVAFNVMDGVRIEGWAAAHDLSTDHGDGHVHAGHTCATCSDSPAVPQPMDDNHVHLHDHGDGVLHSHSHDHEGGHGHGSHAHGHQHNHNVRGFDPHLWTDPVYASDMAQSVASVFMFLDAPNAEGYRARADSLIAELLEIHNEFTALAASVKDTTIVFCGHSAFGHFAKRYGFRILRPYSGSLASEQTSPVQLANLFKTVREGGYKTIFTEEGMSPKLAEMLARDLDVEILTLHGGHTVSKEEMKAGVTWMSLMRDNLRSLKKGLQ